MGSSVRRCWRISGKCLLALRVIGHIFGGNTRQRLFLGVDCGHPLFRLVRKIVQLFELENETRLSSTWHRSRVHGSRVDKNSRLTVLYFGAVEIECDVYSCTLCVLYDSVP